MSTGNEDRAERAEQVLQVYVEGKGEAFERSSDEVCDLIANLLHLTNMLHVGTPQISAISTKVVAMAKIHFDAEINNLEEGGSVQACQVGIPALDSAANLSLKKGNQLCAVRRSIPNGRRKSSTAVRM